MYFLNSHKYGCRSMKQQEPEVMMKQLHIDTITEKMLFVLYRLFDRVVM